MNSRVRALCDLSVDLAREGAGRHEYDGVVQDLSPAGVTRALAALGGPALDDAHDEAHLTAFENAARVAFGELQLHRANPLFHIGNLDLACYDREYAPEQERAEARRRHLRRWPDAIDAAIEALDRVPAPVAESTIGGARGLATGLLAGSDADTDAALRAHERLVSHLERIAASGPAETALGAAPLARLLGSAEALEVDLHRLAERAERERDRLLAMLAEACERIAPGRSVEQTVAEMLADYPDADGVLEEARELTAEVIAWTNERGLVPHSDGECRVGPAPESRQWAMAMMAWAAPGEAAGPSWYYVTPPRPEWPAQEQREWLQVFSRTTLPAITIHEVAPGHFSHGIGLRHAPGEVRRSLFSEAFIEGWAHYTEEMALQEGFHGEDPRFAVGVCIEALVRVTRLACSIGLHTGAMDVAEAARRFEQDAFLAGPAAMSEARRGTFDPTYGRYTWGKLAVFDAREEARKAWGADFSLARFHAAMFELGSPPLGLLGTAIERG